MNVWLLGAIAGVIDLMLGKNPKRKIFGGKENLAAHRIEHSKIDTSPHRKNGAKASLDDKCNFRCKSRQKVGIGG